MTTAPQSAPYRLYWRQNTGAFGPEAALCELGLDYERVPVDFDGLEVTGSAYRAVNPMGQVPALLLEDGTLLTETAAILIYLSDAHPAAGLLPPPGTPARGGGAPLADLRGDRAV